jgi:two-component sensor histidine kinase
MTIDGVPLAVRGTFAQTFALVLHELATNAAKYGSLSTPHGRVFVKWTVESDASEPRLTFSWLERDGPPVKEPGEKGFGTLMISEALKGTSSVLFNEGGLQFRLEVPLSELG